GAPTRRGRGHHRAGPHPGPGGHRVRRLRGPGPGDGRREGSPAHPHPGATRARDGPLPGAPGDPAAAALLLAPARREPPTGIVTDPREPRTERHIPTTLGPDTEQGMAPHAPLA